MPIDEPPSDNFEKLLSWLAPDRERAGEKYEQIRKTLLDYFRRRNASDPSSLADEVFVRVTRRVADVAGDFEGEPSRYFLAVARRVIAEWWRRPVEADLPAEIPVFLDAEEGQRKELALECLERCWERLPADERDALYRYYVGRPPLTLQENRKQLAADLGLTMNALRVTTHRLKVRLRPCIERLMETKNVK